MSYRECKGEYTVTQKSQYLEMPKSNAVIGQQYKKNKRRYIKKWTFSAIFVPLKAKPESIQNISEVLLSLCESIFTAKSQNGCYVA